MNKMKKLLVLVGGFVLFFVLQAVCVMADTTDLLSIPEGYYRFRNVKSDMYLDCEGLSKGNNIRQLAYDSAHTPQKFLSVHLYNGYYSMLPYEAQNMSVDVMNASASNNANIQVYSFNGGTAQQWGFVSNGNGTFRIVSACSGGSKAIVVQNASTVSGANVIQYQYNASVNDQWYLEAEIEEGTYYIRNKKTGLYLTQSGNYIKQQALNTNSIQTFKITPSSNGYHDIAPSSNLDWSVGVDGAGMDMDEEGALVIATQGQSYAGQRWRFLLNGDGSTFRIMSELSECEKAITVKAGNNYVYSNTYTQAEYAGWELIRVEVDYEEEGNKDYVKEGEHVVVALDTENYLRNHISVEAFNQWVKNLDIAYEQFEDLVGGRPHNGEKIWIISGEVGTMETIPNVKFIWWKEGDIKAGLEQIEEYGDWYFGALHEMGHAFDIDPRWNFGNCEFMANFKMAYVFYKMDGKFTVVKNAKAMNYYSEIINYYKSNSYYSFDNTLGASNMTYHHDGLTYVFLEQIQKYGSWNYVKNTFKTICALPASQTTNTSLEKYELFIDTLDVSSSGKFLYHFENDYSKQFDFIKQAIAAEK